MQTPNQRPRRSMGAVARALTALAVLQGLPRLTCPACWPAGAGWLAVLDLGFLDDTPYQASHRHLSHAHAAS